MLIPSLALVVTGGVFAGIRFYDGIHAREWSNGLTIQIAPVIGFVDAAQNERARSLGVANGDPRVLGDLQTARKATDAAVQKMSDIALSLQRLNPDAMTKSTPAFRALVAQLPAIRERVDGRALADDDIDDFYTKLVGVVATGLDGAARTSPFPATVAEETVASGLLRISDLGARAAGIAAAASGNISSTSDRLRYITLVASLHNQLDAVSEKLTGAELTRYQRLVASDEWRLLVGGQPELAETGQLPSGWSVAQRKVDAELKGLWGDQFQDAEREAVSAAERMLVWAIVAGVAVLVIAVLAFVVATHLARALVARLRSLRNETLELAEHVLPAMVQRLHDGQPVDVDSELVVIDAGIDEIGEVAEAFNAAQRTAVAAAEAEAKTRGGINRVYLDIARRSQVVVHQQLKVLDAAEAKQDDPEHLELLFQLDHLATRARRNAENLLILGGEQPGRKWRQPVSLEEVVRSAVSETRDFSRVSAVRLPEVRVHGRAVADLIHLLAELIDNASAFSPPDAVVSVGGHLVGKG
ncbi:nitrate- and nitrite sensing domain-containing protein, partial [Nocardia sp. NPDC059154]